MNYLKHTSAWTARFRGLFPQYWMDKAVEEAYRRHPQLMKGQTVPGQVLAVMRHPQLELEVKIPGLSFAPVFVQKGIHRFANPAVLLPGLNLVTNEGDVYYSARGAEEASPPDDFSAAAAGLRHGSASTTPGKTDIDVTTFLAGTGLPIDATYPVRNDGDADNTGAGADVTTWRFSYGTSDGNATGIAEGAIVDDRTTPTAALTHFLYTASFDKTSSDTLKVFVNHTFTGV